MRRARLCPALALLIALALTPAAVPAPALADGGRCACTGDTLECKGRNKTRLPPDELCGRQVDKWELSRNRLTQLAFLPSPCHVVVLDVAFNRLEALDGALQTCADLFMLILSGNPLRALPDAAFQGMPHLGYLELDATQLHALGANAFAGLSALYSLNLRGNALSALPGRVFASLNRLSFLDVSENSLEAFPDELFAGLAELRFLNASANRLRSLQPGLFAGAQQLLGLNLSGNQLQALDGEALVGLVHLRRLELQDNRLTQVPLLQECCLHAHLVDLRRNNISSPSASPLRALLLVSHRLESDLRGNPVARPALCGVLRAAGALPPPPADEAACEAPGAEGEGARCLCGRLRSCRQPRECWPVVHLCEAGCSPAPHEHQEWAWDKTDDEDGEEGA